MATVYHLSAYRIAVLARIPHDTLPLLVDFQQGFSHTSPSPRIFLASININLVPSDSRASALFPADQCVLVGLLGLSSCALRGFPLIWSAHFRYFHRSVSLRSRPCQPVLWTLRQLPRRNDLLRRLHQVLLTVHGGSNPRYLR